MEKDATATSWGCSVLFNKIEFMGLPPLRLLIEKHRFSAFCYACATVGFATARAATGSLRSVLRFTTHQALRIPNPSLKLLSL